METNINLRFKKSEKETLKTLAMKVGMTTSDYIKYKLFDQNLDLANAKSVYHCPSGEHYNYVIAAFSMLNYMLLDSLVKKENGQEEGCNIINKSLNSSKEKLEKIYGYKKIKDKNDE